MEQMKAVDIMERLKRRHAEDVFVPECKDGPTWGSNHLRLDAWAMARSWAHPCIYGYEIKVSRSDFIKDVKLQNYLPLCNVLFVVAPTGVIQSLDELPDGIGLLQASPAHFKLLTKKKAAFREITDPTELYRYVLMSRAEITGRDVIRYGTAATDRAAYWTEWLTLREVNHDLGTRVSKTLREVVRAKIEEVAKQMSEVMAKNASYQEIKGILESFGIDTHHFTPAAWEVRRKLEAHRKGFPEELERTLDWAWKNAEQLQKAIKEVETALKREEGGGRG